jgi:hypothetical protein
LILALATPHLCQVFADREELPQRPLPYTLEEQRNRTNAASIIQNAWFNRMIRLSERFYIHFFFLFSLRFSSGIDFELLLTKVKKSFKDPFTLSIVTQIFPISH